MSEAEKPDLRVVESVPADECGQSAGDEADAGPDDEARLSPREVRFCEALAAGEPPCHAAELAGVTTRTGRRWRQRPEIQAAVRSRLNDSLGSARAILAQGSARAARSLVDMSDGESDATSPKVAASRAVIESATNLTAVQELEARLAELEARQGQQPGQPGQFRRKP
jgi:hypothetical protein